MRSCRSLSGLLVSRAPIKAIGYDDIFLYFHFLFSSSFLDLVFFLFRIELVLVSFVFVSLFFYASLHFWSFLVYPPAALVGKKIVIISFSFAFKLHFALLPFNLQLLIRRLSELQLRGTVPKLTSRQPNHAQPASIQCEPTRPQSRPYEQTPPASYLHPALPLRSNAPAHFTVDPQLQATALVARGTEPFPSPHLSSTHMARPTPHWSPAPSPHIHVRAYSRELDVDPTTFVSSAQLTPSRTLTWPAQAQPDHLQVPRGSARERSASQPPAGDHLRSFPGGPQKRRLTSDFDERPSSIVQHVFC
ncbi:hypothetical protein CC80DRAFT_240398 [Byssothecium circinans]|uniref:Uncharacterized protein n=1 Tax=Byssothecium circinans TaxID=147558 RepID=A0A6A5THT0_9PLEO|nr:hypothetical protein CC80DRAFT_240398 [Byssothecium circinans]